MTPCQIPEQSILRGWFDYSPDDGLLRWKPQPHWVGSASHRLKLVGLPAGNRSAKNGYVSVQVLRRHYLAHRIIWKWAHGVEPGENIDHINGIRHDNRLANLREATNAQNCMNKSARVGKVLPKGVHPHRGRYHVKIGLGTFDTVEEASAEYERVSRLLYGDFARSK